MFLGTESQLYFKSFLICLHMVVHLHMMLEIVFIRVLGITTINLVSV